MALLPEPHDTRESGFGERDVEAPVEVVEARKSIRRAQLNGLDPGTSGLIEGRVNAVKQRGPLIS
ncbi:MAG TPA: hypothetical protein VMU68_04675 [Acidimicrobiales bacterium]|nr:hypothetical protein [Acidimicrobiales bacterium]